MDFGDLVNKVQSKANDLKNKAMGLTPVEIKVNDATNDEAWGPHGSLMQDIADASNYHADRRLIMPILFKKLDCVGKQWRQCYKALLVLEFLSIRGPTQVEEQIREQLYVVKDISKNFRYHDEKKVDQGLNVRERAKKLHELLTNYDLLEMEREKAQQTRDKINGKTEVKHEFRERDREKGRQDRREEEKKRKENQRQEDQARLDLAANSWKEQQAPKTTITPIAGPQSSGKSRQPVMGQPKTYPAVPPKADLFPSLSQPTPVQQDDFNPRTASTQPAQPAQPAQQDVFGDLAAAPQQQPPQQPAFDPFSAPPTQPPQQQQFEMFQSAPAQQQQPPQQQAFDPFSAPPSQQQPQQQQQQFDTFQQAPQQPPQQQQQFDMFQSAPAQQQQQPPQQQAFDPFSSAPAQQVAPQQQAFDPFSSPTPAAKSSGGMDDLFGGEAAPKKSTEESFLGDLAGALGGMDVGNTTKASPKGNTGNSGGRTLAQLNAAQGPPQAQGGTGMGQQQAYNPGMQQTYMQQGGMGMQQQGGMGGMQGGMGGMQQQGGMGNMQQGYQGQPQPSQYNNGGMFGGQQPQQQNASTNPFF